MAAPATSNGKPTSSASRFAGRRVRNYFRPLDQWLFHPALRDGRFTLMDVPAMQQDNAVALGTLAIFGPILNAKHEVRANSKDVKQFVESCIHRFWNHDLVKVLEQYVPYGSCVGETMYEQDAQTGIWNYAGLDVFDTRDVQLFKRGRHLSRAVVSRNNSMLLVPAMPDQQFGGLDNELTHPKLFACSHRPNPGQLYGKSCYAPAWGPWTEKSGSHGALSIRRLWAFSNAFRGCWVRFPAGGTQKRSDGTIIDNQDIAREIAENYCTGAAGAIPSEVDENGHQLWEIIDPKLNGEIKGLMEYPTDLNREIWKGMGVLDEVISAPDVGGWLGHNGPMSAAMLIFLNIIDMRVREITAAFDVGLSGYTTRSEIAGGVIRPLVMENFGPKAKYEISPVSLIPKPKAEPGAGGSPASAPGAAMPPPPPPPGAPPGAPPGQPGMPPGLPSPSPAPAAPPIPGFGAPLTLSQSEHDAGVEMLDHEVEAILSGRTVCLSHNRQDDEPLTIAVDLDGVLAEYDGWQGEEHIGEPRDGAREAMQRLRDEGHTIIVFTTRGDHERVGDWLHGHGIPFDHINVNPDQPAGSSGKVIADVYIDDRAVDGRRSWPEILGEIVGPQSRFALDAAASHADPQPSEEQKEKGNYRKGHVRIHGLPITIENAAGSTRSGVGADGTPWTVTMRHHYGYIKRTESAADGDHVDVFIGPCPESEIVFVVDQNAADGAFDEHKAMIGFTNAKAAKEGYLANYSPGWRGCGDITALPIEAFKCWLEDGDTGAPLSEQSISLSAAQGSLFEMLHPRGAKGRFTHKPIPAEDATNAQRAKRANKLSVKTSPEPIVSDASGEEIRHYVALKNGFRVHPDELHRLEIADGETILSDDEGLTIHDPQGRGKAQSFSAALRQIGAFKTSADEPVTIVSRHGYSAKRPRSEWIAHQNDHAGGEESFSAWYDREGHKHTGRQVGGGKGAVKASEEETERYFAPRGEQGRLAFSTGGEWDATKHPRGQRDNAGWFAEKQGDTPSPPSPTEPPKHGSRATALHSQRQDWKKARLDAFNQIKAEAQAARDAASQLADDAWSAIGEVVQDAARQDTEDLLQHLVNEDESATEKYRLWADLEGCAAKGMRVQPVKTGGDDDPTGEEMARDRELLQRVIDSARAARKHIRAYIKHRREMQAIKEGSPMDVQLSMALPDDDDYLNATEQLAAGVMRLSAARAPRGYTEANPLMIQGQGYVGGEFIPSAVMAHATPQERAAVYGEAQPQASAPPAAAPPAQSPQVAARAQGESDKAYAKRVIDQLQVGPLPEKHADYFNVDKADATLPIHSIVSTKTDEENVQGGANAPARMWAASQGLLSKRDPISVRKVGDKYHILDGNGTFTAAKRMGWKSMPVQIEKPSAQETSQAGAKHEAHQPPWDDDGGDIVRTHNSMDVPRNRMPNIAKDKVPVFLSELAATGVRAKTTQIEVGRLKPIQGQLSKKQMAVISGLPAEVRASPVIVSSDGYILDGHHRWGSLVGDNPKNKINAHVVNLPMRELLQEASSFRHATRKEAVPSVFNSEELALPKNARQPVPPDAGYAALAEKGKEATHQLQELLDLGHGIASQLGYETFVPANDQELIDRCSKPGSFVVIAPVKGEKRSTEKVKSDFADEEHPDGDWSKLLDIARASLVVDTFDDIEKVINKMRDSGTQLARRPKDRTTERFAPGYRDVMVNVRLPNGIVGECLIICKAMMAAKASPGGHKNYEITRSIDAKMKMEGRDTMTAEEKPVYDAAMRAQEKIYDAAWEKSKGSNPAFG